MNYIAVDTETFLISPGNPAPKLVCVSVCDDSGSKLLDHKDGLEFFRQKIRDKQTIVYGHNFVFDLGVFVAEDPRLLPDVFSAIDDGRVQCTMINEQIVAIAEGEFKFISVGVKKKKVSFSLAAIADKRLGIELSKGKDTWRLRYGELYSVKQSDWPTEAVEYAVKDAVTTAAIYKAQQQQLYVLYGKQAAQHSVTQMQAAWALHLLSIHGIRTDKRVVDMLSDRLKKQYESLRSKLIEYGYIGMSTKKGVPKYSKKLATIRNRVETLFLNEFDAPPLTEGGAVKTGREVLEMTKDEKLGDLAEFCMLEKLLGTYIPVVQQGTQVPINASYQVMVETFRTSCRQPNMQNPPRKGGIRECFKARDGYAFVTSDYDTLELRSLAQVCLDLFGMSDMAEALRKGLDLHLAFAASLLGVPYEDAKARYELGDDEVTLTRQLAKIANFGLPGGMGVTKFSEHVARSGFDLPEEKVKELHEAFRASWSEMKQYFEHASFLARASTQIKFVRSELYRGDVIYTSICNGYFQHLAAMGAKEALYLVTKACYLDKKSPLYGSRPVVFMHDEIMLEAPSKETHEVGQELVRLMKVGMEKWIPDVPITCSAAAMYRWYKGAKPVFDGGRLVPGRPEKQGDRIKWVPDYECAFPDAIAIG